MEFINDQPVWTDEERAQIAAEHDRLATRLWPAVERAEAAGDQRLARRLREQACDAMDVAEAARISSAALARCY